MGQFFTLIEAIFTKEPCRSTNLLFVLRLHCSILWFELCTIKWRKSRFYHRMNIIYWNFTHYLCRIDATNQWIIVVIVLCKWEFNWSTELWVNVKRKCRADRHANRKCTIDMLDYCAVCIFDLWLHEVAYIPHLHQWIERYLICIDKLCCGKCTTW